VRFDFTDFQKELEILINRHSVDNYCNTHDFVLANLLVQNIAQIAVMNDRERHLREDE
jgi:hypothetical protein